MSRRTLLCARPAGRAILALCLAAAGVTCSVEKVTFTEEPPAPVTIGGTISGLAGQGLVLSLNGGEELPITGDGPFAFATQLPPGTSYALAVSAQPRGPSQTCSIANGTGIAGEDAIREVQVSCETVAFSVGGTVTGLAGQGLALQLNGGETLAIAADGSFAFANPLASGAAYEISIAMQPALPTQACEIAGGTGTVGDGEVTGIQITCATSSFTIGGTVAGLAGTGLVLRNNGGDDLLISGNGPFTFPTPVPSGETFAVTVRTQPGGPQQTCAVMGGTGTVGGGAVTSVTVDCATNRYMIGGTISGLAGAVTLRNNGGDDLQLTANGTFAFATTVASGGMYAVTVHAQPTAPAQTCVVAAGTGSGTVGTADVTSVVVTCTTNRYTIGGTLSGLGAGNSLTLRNNGGNDLVLTANGSFAFSTTVPSGGTYAVTRVADPTSPIAQTCTLTNASGTVGAANVTSVQVSCVTRTFTIGGTLTGLAAGNSVTLRNNGGNSLTLMANGSFTFSTPVASGATYAVTVQTQPSSPPQTCTVTNGSGTVGAANVTNVQVSCGGLFTIGGTVTGLSSPGLVLRLNAVMNLSIASNGPFTFPTLIPSGAPYTVSIQTQPAGDSCAIANASGIVGPNVTNVQVRCGTWSPALFPIDIPNGSGYGDIELDANGNLLVVVGGPNRIVRVNRVTGQQTQVATLSGANFRGVTSRGDTVYGAFFEGQIFAVSASGGITLLANAGSQVNAIAVAPSTFGPYVGFVIGVTQTGSVLAIHPTTGAVTPVASAVHPMSDLAFAPDGTLYVGGGDRISRVSPDGGVSLFLGGFHSVEGLAFSPDGGLLFAVESSPNALSRITVPGAVATQIGAPSINGGFAVSGLAAAPGGTLIVNSGEGTQRLLAFPF